LENIKKIKSEEMDKEFKEIKELSNEDKRDIEKLQVSQKEVKQEKKTSDWIIVIPIAVIIIILAAVISLKFIKEDQPNTIEDLHLANLKEELKSDEGYIYNGYSFVFANGLWYTQVQNIAGTSLFNIPLHYSPKDLEDIPIEGIFNATLFNSERGIYITFDPLGSNLQYVALAVSEFDQNIIKAFNKIPIAACDRNETDACADRPIITCKNTDKPVLYIQQEAETKIIYDGNCMIVQGIGPEIVRAVDRLLLQLYGIMP